MAKDKQQFHGSSAALEAACLRKEETKWMWDRKPLLSLTGFVQAEIKPSVMLEVSIIHRRNRWLV